jgi:hypothetical protein
MMPRSVPLDACDLDSTLYDAQHRGAAKPTEMPQVR